MLRTHRFEGVEGLAHVMDHEHTSSTVKHGIHYELLPNSMVKTTHKILI